MLPPIDHRWVGTVPVSLSASADSITSAHRRPKGNGCPAQVVAVYSYGTSLRVELGVFYLRVHVTVKLCMLVATSRHYNSYIVMLKAKARLSCNSEVLVSLGASFCLYLPKFLFVAPKETSSSSEQHTHARTFTVTQNSYAYGVRTQAPGSISLYPLLSLWESGGPSRRVVKVTAKRPTGQAHVRNAF